MLALGAGSAALLLGSTPARGLTVTVGGLSFAVPETIRSVPADSSLGQGWQWLGRVDQPSADRRAAIVVLARADIGSIDPQEILGLLLAATIRMPVQSCRRWVVSSLVTRSCSSPVGTNA